MCVCACVRACVCVCVCVCVCEGKHTDICRRYRDKDITLEWNCYPIKIKDRYINFYLHKLLVIGFWLMVTRNNSSSSLKRIDLKPTAHHWDICSIGPVLHDWCNKGRGMCYPVCGMVHIKEPLLLIGKSSLCGGSSRFPLSLSEWSFTICLTPYDRK